MTSGKGLPTPFLLSHVDGHALLIPRDTAPPWAHAIDIELSPDAERVTDVRWLDLDHFRAIMSKIQSALIKSPN